MKKAAKIIATVNKFGLAFQMNRAFSGGVSLAPIEGEKLPGIKAYRGQPQIIGSRLTADGADKRGVRRFACSCRN
jgi:hypothetical protein